MSGAYPLQDIETPYSQFQKHAKEWIECILCEPLPADRDLFELLKDGTVLCKLLNTLAPHLGIQYSYTTKLTLINTIRENVRIIIKQTEINRKHQQFLEWVQCFRVERVV